MLMLSAAAVEYIVWKANERQWREAGLTEGADSGDIRILFLRSHLGPDSPDMFELSRRELLSLDNVLTGSFDPKDGGKLSDGTPIEDLVRLVWRELIGDTDAGNSPDDDTYADRLADANRLADADGEPDEGAAVR